MIKKYSLFIVAICFSATFFSQSVSSDSSLSKASVSLLPGILSSHYGGTSQFLSRSQKQSLCATLSLQVPITKVVFFSTDVAYREMGERQYVTILGNATLGSGQSGTNQDDKLFLRIPYMRVNVCVGFHISNNISLHIGGYVGYRGSINTRGSEQQDWYVDERRESLESSLYKNDYGLVEQVQTQFPLNKYFDFIGRLELSQGLMNIWHPTTVNPPDIYYMNIQTSLSVGLRYNFQ